MKFASFFFFLISLFIVNAFVKVAPREKFHNYGEQSHAWDSLKGLTGEEAKNEILKSNPELKVQILPHNAMVTMDFRLDRVRVFVNEEGKVVRPPRIG